MNNTVWHTIGHDNVLNMLRVGLAEGRLSHAYMMLGGPRVGKMTLAKELAQAVNCTNQSKPCGQCKQCNRILKNQHTDVRILGVGQVNAATNRSRNVISIEQVREIQREASLKPFEGKSRVFIFENAERLSEEASNSLLKILEEPPDDVLILLLTSNLIGLQETVVSRCQILRLTPVSQELIKNELVNRYDAEDGEADKISRMSEGRPGWAFEAISNRLLLDKRSQKIDLIQETINAGLVKRFDYASQLANSLTKNRLESLQELDLWLNWWRDVMLAKNNALDLITNVLLIETIQQNAAAYSTKQIFEIISIINKTISHLESNANPKLALEEMMIAMPSPTDHND